MINIGSQPEHVEGILKIGDEKKSFRTPYVLSGINLDADVKATITLYKRGFTSTKDSFTVSRQNPIFSKVYKLKSKAPGRLSVQARPWGYVYIPGLISKRESPVNNIKIKPGKYSVKVYYSPANLWARSSVKINSGGIHSCIADFTNGAAITCR